MIPESNRPPRVQAPPRGCPSDRPRCDTQALANFFASGEDRDITTPPPSGALEAAGQAGTQQEQGRAGMRAAASNASQQRVRDDSCFGGAPERAPS